MHERVVGFRRHIHRHAELSFQENETADFITRVLTAEGLECTPIAGTGVLVKIVGGGDPKQAVVLRADIDALPVHEATDLDFASVNDGVMHACGHDMHTAALMGALILINRNRKELTGTLFGLFQPGEELLPGGAGMVLIEDPFKDYNIRAFFGQHVDAELPTGVFGLRAGEYMASTDEIYITVHGEGGHAAMPALLKNPIPAAAALVLELAAISAGVTTPNVLTIGRIIADGATNIIPDKVEMEGTMRTFDERWRAETKKLIRAVTASTAMAYGVRAEADIRDGYPSVKNDAGVTDTARELMVEAFGKDAVIALDRRMTGEDFGLYTQKYPSLFYRFGVGGPASSSDAVGAEGCSHRKYGDGQPCQNVQQRFGLTGHAGKLHSASFNPDERSLMYAVAGLVTLASNF